MSFRASVSVIESVIMKKLWAVLAILLTVSLPLDAHAKRFGGGKSFGRSYQTTPYSAPHSASGQPSRADAASATRPQPAAAQPQTPGRKGMLGGLLGGMLAGGLLAALFAGGAFHGIQFMDILLIAAAAFAVMFLLRQWRARSVAGQSAPQPAYAAYMPPMAREGGHAAADAAPATIGVRPIPFGASAEASASPSVPMNLPLGFDSPVFLAEAGTHYRILQDAWNRNDLDKIREYCTPELFDLLRGERASLSGEQHTEVLALHSELVRADQAFGVADISIRFSGRYRDAVERVEEDFVDIWHLERDYSRPESPWRITGVESA